MTTAIQPQHSFEEVLTKKLAEKTSSKDSDCRAVLKLEEYNGWLRSRLLSVLLEHEKHLKKEASKKEAHENLISCQKDNALTDPPSAPNDQQTRNEGKTKIAWESKEGSNEIMIAKIGRRTDARFSFESDEIENEASRINEPESTEKIGCRCAECASSCFGMIMSCISTCSKTAYTSALGSFQIIFNLHFLQILTEMEWFQDVMHA